MDKGERHQSGAHNQKKVGNTRAGSRDLKRVERQETQNETKGKAKKRDTKKT